MDVCTKLSVVRRPGHSPQPPVSSRLRERGREYRMGYMQYVAVARRFTEASRDDEDALRSCRGLYAVGGNSRPLQCGLRKGRCHMRNYLEQRANMSEGAMLEVCKRG
jgi:hypothetical protein